MLNYPNPFNSVTFISYQLPHSASVILTAYDGLDRLVEVVTNEIQLMGSHTLKWDGSMYSPGLYYYQLNWDGNAKSGIDRDKAVGLYNGFKNKICHDSHQCCTRESQYPGEHDMKSNTPAYC